MRTLKLTIPLLILLTPVFALAGSQTFSTPGTYTFTVPSYGTLTVTLLGGGGGGGGGQGGSEPENGEDVAVGDAGLNGADGGDVSFGTLTAKGGRGGCGGGLLTCNFSHEEVFFPEPGKTGGAAGGGSGVGGYVCFNCLDGYWLAAFGGYGEDGVRTVRTYSEGELTPGSTVTVFIGEDSSGPQFDRDGIYENGGQGGGGGAGGLSSISDSQMSFGYSGANGGNGENGGVTITWVDGLQHLCPDGSVPPDGNVNNCPQGGGLSCSVTFNPATLTDGSSVMTYSTNAPSEDFFVINNVGPVGSSGQTPVYATGDYTGTIYAADETTALATCPATLTDGSEGGRYSCNSSNQCISDPNGLYPSSSCNNACTGGPYYACNSSTNQCVQSATGSLLGDCTAVCGQVCANGLSKSTYPSCQCPAGYTVQNGQCVITSCPSGYILQNGQCVRTGSCPNGLNIAQYPSCLCTSPQVPYGSVCATPPLTITKDLTVSPSLVAPGSLTHVYWGVQNAASCSVTGTNGDGTATITTTIPTGIWNTLSSLSSGNISSPIVGQTIYTLFCYALSGGIPPSIQQSATVNIVPTFIER